MAWYEDIVVGAISNGVNGSTLVAVNAVLGLALMSLVGFLLTSINSNPALVPHVVVLIFLELGLWVSINWFILNIGLVDPADQQRELFGPGDGEGQPTVVGDGEAAATEDKGEEEEKKDQ